MSTTIDTRVVEMRFDNKQFESGVSTTMSTLDKLKQKLHLDGASKGLESVSSAAKKVDMSGLSRGIETVSSRFSALDVIGVTALANITNSAINAGKRMVSALTIDPIKSGFQEYETQMNAIQTILANTQSKGSTLDDVKAALNELNKYADLTIYNFTEMTRNIGTFTAAGVDLETSVSAIQGIANLAAVSGSNSQQASTAMYQLSQALASGTVKLMDWNSVVNAGMGGEIFQNALKETSALLGTGAEAAIEAEGSFRESLRTGWLTSEVLTETLKKFTTSGANEYVAEYTGLSVDAVQAALESAEAQYGEADAVKYAAKALAEKSGKNAEEIESTLQMAKTAQDAATKVKTFTQLWDVMKEAVQSGWARTWQIIIGDFEEAKSLLTPISDFFTGVIGKFSDARNNLLESALGKGFADLADKINKVAKPAKEVIDTVENVTSAVSDLGEIVDDVILGKFGNGEERFEKLTAAGMNYYKVQNAVNEKLGVSKRYTEEQIAAQDKLLGSKEQTTDVTKEETKETTKLTEEQKKNLILLGSLTEEELKARGYTDSQIESLKELGATAEKLGIPFNEFINNLDEISGRWLLINSFKNVGLALVDVGKAIAAAWKDVFPKTLEERAESLFNAIAGLHKITANMKAYVGDNIEQITRTFKGLFAAVDIVATVIGGPLKIAFKILVEILGAFDMSILDFTAIIGDAIYGFKEFLDATLDFGEVFKRILPYVIEGIERTKEWFNTFKESQILADFVVILQTCGDRIKELFANLKNSDLAQNLIDGLTNGLRNGADKLWNAAIAMCKDLLAKIKNALGIHSPSTETYAIGENLIEGLVNGLKSGASWLWGIVSGIATTIVNVFKQIFKDADFGTLLAGTISGGMLFVLIKIGRVFEALVEPLEGVGDILRNTAKVVKSFAGVLKSVSTSIKAKALKDIAIAIAILVGSIALLTYLDQDKLLTAMGVLAALAVGLGALGFALSKFGGSGIGLKKSVKNIVSIGKIAGMILAISTSLLLLAGFVKVISGVSWKDLAKAGVGITYFAAIVAGLIAATKLAGPGIDKAGGLILKVSASMLLLAVVAKIIARMSWYDMAKAGVGIAALGVIVAGLIAVTKLAGKDINNVGSTLFKISAGIMLLGVTAKLISGMSWDDMGKAGAGIVGLSTIIVGLIAATKLARSNIDKIGSVILKVGGAILLLGVTAKLISGMPWGELIKAEVGVAGLASIVSGLVYATRLAGARELKRVASTILMMSVSIGILAGVATMLGYIKLENLAKGVIAVGALSAMMSLMFVATKNARNIKGNLVAMTIAIAAMAATVVALSMIDTTKLAVATGALSLLMGMFSLMIKVSGMAKKSIGTIIVMTVVVGLLSTMLWQLAKLPIENTLGAAIGLSALMLAMSGVLIVLGTFSTVAAAALPGMMALTSLVVPMLAFVGVLALMENLDNAMRNVGVITLLMGAMTVMLVALAIAGPLALTGIGAMAGLMGLIVAIGALVIAIGALTEYFPQLETFLGKGIGLLEQLAYGIGSFVGNLVAGFSDAAMSELPKIGQYLSDFMTNAKAFITGAKTVDGSVLAGVGILAGSILALTAVDVSNGVASFLTGGASFATLGTELSNFAINALPFFEIIKMVDPATLEGVKSLAEAILVLTAADVLEGLTAWFTGGTSLADFGKELEAFGPSMKAYAQEVAGIDTEAVKASADAAKTLSEMAQSLPNEGGLLGKIFGENSVDTFGEQLESFGKSLKAYGVAVTGIAVEPINVSVQAAKSLSTMAESIPNMGGVVAWFTGDNDLATFGAKLVSFGSSLKMYSIVVTGLSTESIYASVDATKTLASMADSIPNMGGVVGFFAGDNDLATFGSRLVTFGASLKTYSMSVAGLAIDPIYQSISAARAMAQLATILPSDGGFWSLFKDDTISMSTFGSEIVSLGKGMKAYSDAVAGISVDTVMGSIVGAQQLADFIRGLVGLDISGTGPFMTAINTLSKTSVDKFVIAFTSAKANLVIIGADLINGIVDGIQSGQSKLSNCCNSVLSSVLGVFNQTRSKFKNLGAQLVNNFGNGLMSQMPVVEEAFSAAISDIAQSILDYYYDFYDAGSYVVEGFADGISQNTFEAEAKASAMAEAALEAAKEELGIASPSKEFAKIGEYVSQGLGIGILKDTSAEEAAAVKAHNVKKSFEDEWNRIELDEKTLSLEYELLSVNGETVSESDKKSAEMDLQAKRVQLAGEEYEYAIKEFGETAEETQKAYNKLLEEKIRMSKLSAELSSIQKTEFKNNRDALDEYIAWMESSDKLLDMGFSKKEIDDAGRSATGYTGTLFYDFGDDSARAGESIAEGMADGIEFGKGMAVSAAENLAVATLGIVNSVLGIHSPSKEFAKVGRWSVEGMAVGLDKYSKIVEASAENVGKNALNSISDVVSGISTVFDSDLDVRPEIRPVIDLSNIQNGVGMIDGMFAQRSLALAGINADLSGTSLNINGAIDRMQKLNDSSNAKVIDAISSLRGDFGSLINAIGGMHIRMDSGTVVGELIGKIDTGLGRIANYKGRGI